MDDDAQDIEIARQLREKGMATAEQIVAGLQEQARHSEEGVPSSLADVLVLQGVLTAAHRDAILKKSPAVREGGQKLLHYRLIHKIGQGSMGSVYLAEDTLKSRRVALKVLPKKFAGDARFLQLFQREAKATAALRHPNIITAFEAGEDLGYSFYVMEYCDGEALDRILKTQGCLPVGRALEILLQAARGLGFAHSKRFIHRDIKPANIMLGHDGLVKILDLGLARKLVESESSVPTRSGAMTGTANYISPEQALGDKNIDGRADIYSLGATFYHLLTGRPPFEGGSILEVVSKHMKAQIPNPQDLREDIPDDVVHIVRRMMAKSREDRYGSCEELILDLEAIAEGSALSSGILEPNKSSIAIATAPRRRPAASAGPPKTTRRIPIVSLKETQAYRSRVTRQLAFVAAAALALMALLAVFLTSSGRGSRTGEKTAAEEPVRTSRPPRSPDLIPSRREPEPQKPERTPERPSSEDARKKLDEADAQFPETENGNWKSALDLMPHIDPARDRVSGVWTLEDRELVSDAAEGARIAIPYRPPEEYDFRISFTRVGGNGDVNQILAHSGGSFVWAMGASENTFFGFGRVQGREVNDNPTTVKSPRCFENGRSYVAVVRVRKGGVAAYLDGRRITRFATNFQNMARHDRWNLPDETLLGLASYRSPTVFHSVHLREVSGRGAPRAPLDDKSAGTRPWRPVFNGRSTEGFSDLDGWRLEGEALVKTPGVRNALQTREEFEDGEIRIRFEARDSSYVGVCVRQSNLGKFSVELDRTEVRELPADINELVFTCRGDIVTAALNGKPQKIKQTSPGRRGHVQLSSQEGTFRLLSIEFRELP